MTTKDSILALAAKISNDTVPNVATDAQALGELAKAMCGTAPEVPLATVDDAIAFITANYSGGGGGVDVGALAFVGGIGEAPIVGEEMFTFPIIALAKIGDVAIYDGSPYGASASGGLAGGLTLTTIVVSAELVDTMGAYVCTADGNGQYATIVPWGGTLTRENAEYEGDPGYKWTFTMPELQEGERLMLCPYMAD